MSRGVQLNNPAWLHVLQEEFDQPYMHTLCTFLRAEKDMHKTIFPPEKDILNALESVDFNTVKAVILGQDPYHREGQAHGLCFSVPKGVKIPPSLVNIYKELNEDLGIAPPSHGYLQGWAEQGVLLLNSVLTVESGLAGSHQGRGWEQFTDKIIHTLNEREEPVVFMLWGSYAQKKAEFVNTTKHLVLKAPHPSPLSAHRGFLGCKHFSQANEFLIKSGQQAIDWANLP